MIRQSMLVMSKRNYLPASKTENEKKRKCARQETNVLNTI